MSRSHLTRVAGGRDGSFRGVAGGAEEGVPADPLGVVVAIWVSLGFRVEAGDRPPDGAWVQRVRHEAGPTLRSTRPDGSDAPPVRTVASPVFISEMGVIPQGERGRARRELRTPNTAGATTYARGAAKRASRRSNHVQRRRRRRHAWPGVGGVQKRANSGSGRDRSDQPPPVPDFSTSRPFACASVSNSFRVFAFRMRTASSSCGSMPETRSSCTFGRSF